MSKSGSSGVLTSFFFDHGSRQPIYKQLYCEVRQAILSGRVAPGAKLPATRVLASELGVSRNTVVSVFDQLAAEGYVSCRVGDGTYVAETLPEDHLLPRQTITHAPVAGARRSASLSARGLMLADTPVSTNLSGPMQPRPFCADLPAVDAFPVEAWGRLMTKCWHKITPNILGHVDPAGYGPLREVIAQHLRAARFVRATPEQIIVTSDSQQSLDLIARLLIDPGDPVWIEEPGYIGARSVFAAASARVVPVPIDGAGLRIAEGRAREPAPKLIFISPSRQYPLGMTLSSERRLELLEFANSVGAWIVEDDYDSEFRYSGAALPAVQSLDDAGRVIYLGTFSKSLLPAFRLGYLVVPEALAASFVTAKSVVARHAPILEQMTLYEFIACGQFAAHVRKMRQLYLERRTCLLDGLAQHLSHLITVTPAETGMDVAGFLDDDIDDVAFCTAAGRRGISLRPLSIYYCRPQKRSGVILGFSAVPPPRIAVGVKRLAEFASSYLPTRRDDATRHLELAD